MDLNFRTEHDCLNRIVNAAHSFGSLTDRRSDVIEGLDATLAVGVFQKYVTKEWERSFFNRPNPDECLVRLLNKLPFLAIFCGQT